VGSILSARRNGRKVAESLAEVAKRVAAAVETRCGRSRRSFEEVGDPTVRRRRSRRSSMSMRGGVARGQREVRAPDSVGWEPLSAHRGEDVQSLSRQRPFSATHRALLFYK